MSEFLNINHDVLIFGNLDEGIESLNRQGGYLLMDVDGCLIEGGLETAGNKKTLEEWGRENREEIELFKGNIISLQEKGIMVGLSTGRGLDFSKRFLEYFFGEGKVVLDKSIVEGGLLVYDPKTGGYELAKSVDNESADLLAKNRDGLIKIGESFGGLVEEGKMLALSFNPPLDEMGKRDTDAFRKLLEEKLDKEMTDNLVITNSTTAVDITPKGVDKMTTMETLIGGRRVIYLGDGRNDESSMRNNKVEINLAPGNSHQDIKKFVSSGEKPGLLASKKELAGTNQMLQLLIARLNS